MGIFKKKKARELTKIVIKALCEGEDLSGISGIGDVIDERIRIPPPKAPSRRDGSGSSASKLPPQTDRTVTPLEYGVAYVDNDVDDDSAALVLVVVVRLGLYVK